MKIGVSSYSYSQCLKAGTLDIYSFIDKAKEMGFDGVSFLASHIVADTQEERKNIAKTLGEKAAALGLDVSSYLTGGNLFKIGEELEAEIARIKGEIDIANILGTKFFRYDVIYGMAPMGKSFDMLLNQIVDIMREFADYAAQYGIMTMIENHGYIFQDAYRVEKAVNEVNRDNFRLLVDIGNFTCADEIPTVSVSRVATLAAHVHLKDFYILPYSTPNKTGTFTTRGMNYLRGAAVGEGDVGAAQCIAILKRAGYDGYLDIEFEGQEDCIAALTRGLAYSRECIK